VNFISALFSTENPVLPGPLASWLYLSVAWSLVWAAGLVSLLAWVWPKVTQRFTQQRRTLSSRAVLPCVMGTLTVGLLLGDLSWAYNLGMLFRAPSGVLCMLCIWNLWRRFEKCRQQGQGLDEEPGPLLYALPAPMLGICVLLGLALFLDVFALLPWRESLYAWGFAPITLGGLILLTCLLGAITARQGGWKMARLVLAALLLHLAFRLPTGNVWDAVLDPLLWVWLVGHATRRLTLCARSQMAARRLSPVSS
jgi:hypothetical protein